MHKVILFLVALCFANFVLAADNYWVRIENNDGSKIRALGTPPGYRFCYCLAKTQTNLISGILGGNVKLFSSNDCTGNYANGSGKITYNAQWVNSVSFGVSNKASIWGAGTSCNQYA